MIRAIACIGKNRELGNNNDLIFFIKEDMKYFSQKTTDGIVIMGKNTYLSIGKPLKNRTNVVISSADEFEWCKNVHCIEDAIMFADKLKNIYDVWIIGGAMVYKEFLPYCDELYLTEVDAEKEASVYFPEFANDFELVSSEPQENNEYKFSFNIYKKKC